MTLAIDLSGRSALVTGASRGIGREIAKTLAECGARVAVNYSSDGTSAMSLVKEIRRRGGMVEAVRGDAASAVEVNAIVAKACDLLGAGIDIAVANVGPFRFAPLQSMTPDEFDLAIRCNLNSAFYLAHAVLPHMKAKATGTILTIGLSPAADRIDAAPHIAAYACAKAALSSLTRSMAFEFSPFGVRVAMIAPGLIGHDAIAPVQAQWMARRVPSGRLGTPREVANVAAFLASDLASYCGGGVFAVGGGWDWSQDRSISHDRAEQFAALKADGGIDAHTV